MEDSRKRHMEAVQNLYRQNPESVRGAVQFLRHWFT